MGSEARVSAIAIFVTEYAFFFLSWDIFIYISIQLQLVGDKLLRVAGRMQGIWLRFIDLKFCCYKSCAGVFLSAFCTREGTIFVAFCCT